MSPSLRHQHLLYSIVGIGLGLWTFRATQSVFEDPGFDIFIKGCENPKGSTVENTLIAYEPWLGLGVFESFVCVVTQFLHELVKTYPAGLLTWGATTVVCLPVLPLILFEAGRKGAIGPIRYPIIIGILYQIFGISVIFPLIWVPAFCFGRGDGSISRLRTMAGLILSWPMAILTGFVFMLSPNSYPWTIAAGFLGGPLAAIIGPAILYLLEYFLSSTTTAGISRYERQQSGHRVALAYGISGALAIAGWYGLVFIAWNHYGTNLSSLLLDMGSKAPPSVRFMVIDAVVLYLALLVHIAFRNKGSAVEAVMLTPLFGPGAACALALSGIETMEESKAKEQ